MQDIPAQCIVPFIVAVVGGAIVVLFEYFIVQPIRRAIDASIPEASVGRDWIDAMRRALKRFRAQYYGPLGQWLPRPHENITIDEWEIEKGRATLTLVVNKMLETFEPGIVGFFRVPRVIAKHKLIIDRTGDILEVRSIPVDFSQTGRSTRLPEMTVAVKNKKARLEKVHNGSNAIIEFEVENSGKAGRVFPYIEFQVITTALDGNYSQKKWNTKPKPVEIPALTIQPFKYTLFFEFPALPLVEPPNEVKIEMHPCSSGQSRS